MANFLFILLMPWLHFTESETQPYLKLSLLKNYVLDARLTNPFGHSVQLYEHSLPWKGSNSIMLIAVKANASGLSLQRILGIDDPGPEILRLEPGEMLSGRIELKRLFPDIEGANRDHDVIVFWAYRLDPIDGTPAPRLSGSLIVPKTRPGPR